MTRLVNVSISLALVALILASAAATRSPALAVAADGAGLRITGHGFAARERIVLRITVDGTKLTRRTQASAAGRFATQVAQVDETAPCGDSSTVVITASGGAGSRATATRHVQIPAACGIAPQP